MRISVLKLGGFGRGRGNFANKVPKPIIEELESGGSTLSAWYRRRMAEDRDWQRVYNMRERARRAAENTRDIRKADAKREAKKVYRSLTEIDETVPLYGELADVMGEFSPNLKEKILPPEKAIKFDKLVDNVKALEFFWLAYYEQREKELIAEENAVLGAFLMAA